MLALLADIGGTKTQLACLDNNGHIYHPRYFKNQEYPSFQHLLIDYQQQTPLPSKAVIAVAGPIEQGNACQMTNLSWCITTDALTQQFGFDRIDLINDLQATAWSMVTKPVHSQLKMLKDCQLNFQDPIVIISPGTGLGQACILPQKNDYIISATEGGHKQIAPFNSLSSKIIATHWQKYNRPISWENWFSGSGLSYLYNNLNPKTALITNEAITAQAMSKPNSPAHQCITLFTQGIYSEAGNLALQYLAWGGIILAGGIPPKIESFFSDERNMKYVYKKSQYVEQLKNIPIALSCEQNAPILGAAEYFKRHVSPN